jgi:tRNA-dihydrouridine synthase
MIDPLTKGVKVMGIQVSSAKLDSRFIIAPIFGATDIFFRHLVKPSSITVIFEMDASRWVSIQPPLALQKSKKFIDEEYGAVQIVRHESDVVSESVKFNEDKKPNNTDIKTLKRPPVDGPMKLKMRKDMLASRL